MSTLSVEQVKSREKTLLATVLLSMWAPLTTGIAVALSHSTTQIADFLRRTIEFAALFVSWHVFRYVNRREGLSVQSKARLERFSGLSVAVALCCSSVVMFILAFSRLQAFEPGGNVVPGLVIACLGLATNSYFWRRYTFLTREQHNTIIDAQRQLYRAKASVDVCVVLALATVVFMPGSPLTRYVDIMGSVVVAAYLGFSALRTLRSTSTNPH